ncbi:MAG: DMT family transporter [Kiritimatiellae bacterium]|nr:DMT family transporter [Kiritimatiellia bacterium]
MRRARQAGPFLSLVGASFLWALIPVFTRYVMRSGQLGAYTLAFGRFFFGLIALWVALRLQGRRLSFRGHASRWTVLAGIALGADLVLINHGFKYTTAIVGGLLSNFSFPVMMLLGVVALKEQFGVRKGVGALLVLAGVCLAAGNGQSLAAMLRSSRWTGNLLVLGGASAWAVYALCHKKSTRGGAAVTEGLIAILAVGGLISLALAIGTERLPLNLSAAGCGSVLALGLGCTGLSYALLGFGLKHVELVTAACVTALTPALSVFFGHLLLGEPLTFYAALGALLIGLGIVAAAEKRITAPIPPAYPRNTPGLPPARSSPGVVSGN